MRVGAERVAAGALGPHHLGTEVGQHPPGHRAGLAGQVDDDRSGEQCLRGSRDFA